MRIRTRRQMPDGHKLGLEVGRVDSDGDVFIGTRFDGFYLDYRDVPALIRGLRWAVRKAAPQRRSEREE